MSTHTRCPLLLQLAGMGPTAHDPDEPRRSEPRRRCHDVLVAMRCANHASRQVKVYDVSRSGISIVSQDRFAPGDVISLNSARHIGAYHRFRVLHVAPVGPNYRIGLCLEK